MHTNPSPAKSNEISVNYTLREIKVGIKLEQPTSPTGGLAYTTPWFYLGAPYIAYSDKQRSVYSMQSAGCLRLAGVENCS